MRTPPPAPVELTIDTVDPLVIDTMWAMGANGVLERSDETVVGFDSEGSAQQAIAVLPATVHWSLEPSPPLSSWDSYASVVVDGRFIVRPPWLDPDPSLTPDDPIELVIDPGAAFGHGGHPTTLLALRSLSREIRPGDSVLDVGSGSGVLAIAAAKLGASRVKATDIHPTAVAATKLNARANSVEVESSSTTMHDLTDTFDVVVANMERPTLASHLDELWRLTGRTLILSGVLASDPLTELPHTTKSMVEQLGEWSATTLSRSS